MWGLIPLAISAIGSLVNRNKKTTQTTRSVLNPAYSPLQQMLIDNAEKRMRSPTGLPEGYGMARTSDINQTYDAGRQSLENVLSSRGLFRSPVAGSALASHETARIGDIARMKQGLPMLDMELKNQDLANAMRMLSFGTGGSETITGESGSGYGSTFSNVAQMLAFMQGMGMFQRGQGGGTGGGGSLGADWFHH